MCNRKKLTEHLNIQYLYEKDVGVTLHCQFEKKESSSIAKSLVLNF